MLSSVHAFLAGTLPHLGEGGAAEGVPAGVLSPPPASYLSSSHISPLEPEGDVDRDLPSVTWAEGGRFVKVRVPGVAPESRGRRDEVKRFSSASRRRLLSLVNSINQDVCQPMEFLFVTLTYGESYPAVRATKRHLDTFLKRLERAWGHHWLLWKLEPQRRGAPHYHLLIYWPSIDAHSYLVLLEWVAQAWFEIAGEGDANHKLVHQGCKGNRPCVEVVQSWRAVAAYVGKYLGKLSFGDEEWIHQGRYWGQRRSELAPCTLHEENVSQVEAKLLRRQLIRHFQHEASGVIHFSGRQTASGVHQPGFNLRRDRKVDGKPLSSCWLELAQDLGRRVWIKRRRWPTSRGGFTGFVDVKVFYKYRDWARREAADKCNVLHKSSKSNYAGQKAPSEDTGLEEASVSSGWGASSGVVSMKRAPAP